MSPPLRHNSPPIFNASNVPLPESIGTESSNFLDLRPIKPNFVRMAPERSPEEEDEYEDAQPAATSLVPCLTRPEYYSSPSVEAMAKMSEAKLRQVDNLEIGRHGFGSVKWPGLTDVRRMNFDELIVIERGNLTLYPYREKPKVGEGLNKEAVICLHVRPSRADARPKGAEQLQARLAKISEAFGGQLISYDMEKWLFRVPHFNGLADGS